MSQSVPERWVELLSDEDRTFVKRFILTSGSLKELADAYGITYPTVRLRLDRLIEKIKVFDKNDTADDYERLLRGLYAEGRFDASTFHQLLKHYQQEYNPNHEDDPPPHCNHVHRCCARRRAGDLHLLVEGTR